MKVILKKNYNGWSWITEFEDKANQYITSEVLERRELNIKSFKELAEYFRDELNLPHYYDYICKYDRKELY